MTVWIAAYLSLLGWATARAWMRGDALDVLAAFSIWIAQGAVYAALLIPGASAVGVTGAVWALHATTLLIWFARPADTWITVFSAAIAVLAALALFGLLPAARCARRGHRRQFLAFQHAGHLWPDRRAVDRDRRPACPGGLITSSGRACCSTARC